ncbi:hypothetical protein FJU08_14225 [Martelella alba]|uniref:Uncharacterized protein n=1 Tax=Martelella alba TaxID=2590451 RepID=A0A506U944_9HYPH|nr:hypothetical protein FJU08_14225 [Martelella alba]
MPASHVSGALHCAPLYIGILPVIRSPLHRHPCACHRDPALSAGTAGTRLCFTLQLDACDEHRHDEESVAMEETA